MIPYNLIHSLFDTFSTKLNMRFIQANIIDEKPVNIAGGVFASYNLLSEQIEQARNNIKEFSQNQADPTKVDIKVKKKSRPIISINFISESQADGEILIRAKADELINLIQDQSINEETLNDLVITVLSPSIEDRTAFLGQGKGAGYEYKIGFDIMIDFCQEKITEVERMEVVKMVMTPSTDDGTVLPDIDIEVPPPVPTTGNTPYQDKIIGIAGANMVCYYPLNESTGSDIIDLSGKMSNGLYVSVTLANSLSPSGTMAPLFDGILSYGQLVAAELDALLTTDEFTFGYFLAPVLPWDASGYAISFTKDNATNNFYTHRVTKFLGNDVYQYLAVQAATATSLLPQPATPDAAFKYIAYTFSKSNNRLRCYEDGVEIASGTIPSNDNGTTFTDFFLATLNSGLTSKLNARMSDFVMFNTEATPAQVISMGTPGA